MNPAVTLKLLLASALSAPLLWLAWLIVMDVQVPGSGLGADASESVVHYLGEWALIVLLAAYSITPLRRLTKFPGWSRSRRMVGLFAFSYVVMHLLSYLGFYLGFSWQGLFEDLVDRAYITAGMGAFTCLLAMAVTSTRGWQRRLRRRWQQIHQLIYPAIGLALVHLWWLTRDGYAEVFLFTAWFVLLSLERLAAANGFKRWRDARQPQR